MTRKLSDQKMQVSPGIRRTPFWPGCRTEVKNKRT